MAEDGKKPKRKHLHEVRLESTRSGHVLEHHTYKKHRDDTETEPERKNVAVHATPEEAGQSAGEAMAQNEPPDANADPGAMAPAAGGGGDPTGGAPGMAQ